MAKYRVTTEGGTYDIETEDGGQEQPKKEQGLGGKVWDALDVPRQKSAEGLNMIGDAMAVEPNGNMARDIAVNTPSVVTKSLAKVAPSFVDRAAILTAGAGMAAKGAAKIPAVAKGAGQALDAIEGFTGMTKGSLGEAIKNPKTIISQGADEAGKAFDTLGNKSSTPAIRKATKAVDELLTKAYDGTITAVEAHKARKMTWQLLKNPDLDKEALSSSYDLFDGIVKKAAPGADAAFQKGLRADSLRQVFPRTETGKVAQLRTLGLLMGGPKAWAASPIVSGVAATGLGVANKLAGTIPGGLATGASPELVMQAYDAMFNKNKRRNR